MNQKKSLTVFAMFALVFALFVGFATVSQAADTYTLNTTRLTCYTLICEKPGSHVIRLYVLTSD